MKLTNKIFYMIILGSFLLSAIIGVSVRATISEFKFEDIDTTVQYRPFEDVEFSNGYFPYVDEVSDTDSLYRYVVKVKVLGNRRVYQGAVATEVEVENVLKGDISSKTIVIYEPIEIYNKFILSYDGYNFVKDGKEYILGLTDVKDGVEDTYKGNKTYLYASTFYGKFPVEYTESDYGVYEESLFDDLLGYEKFKNYEQIFTSEHRKEQYIKEYNRLITKYKNLL